MKTVVDIKFINKINEKLNEISAASYWYDDKITWVEDENVKYILHPCKVLYTKFEFLDNISLYKYKLEGIIKGENITFVGDVVDINLEKIENKRNHYFILTNISTNSIVILDKKEMNEVGLDPIVCEDIISTMEYIENLNIKADSFFDYNSSLVIRSQDFKKFGYYEIKANGYLKNKTVRNILDKMFKSENLDPKILPNNDQIEKMDEWFEEYKKNPVETNYIQNVEKIWNNEFYHFKDLNLAASLIYTYFKYSSSPSSNTTLKGDYIANIGDKIEINIKSYVPLYTNTYRNYGDQNSSTLYKIIDEFNNVYIWSTSNSIDENIIRNFKLEATIKDHRLYNEEKQNIITRGKFYKK